MYCKSYLITGRERLARDVYGYRVRCPEICGLVQPGQFAHVGVPGFSLRRPISICGADLDTGEIRLVFEVRGGGTRSLSQLRENDKMDILAPLGHGFELLGRACRAAVVGGGIGAPPLLGLARYYGDNCNAILGFRSRAHVLLDTEFASWCDTVTCTDDGSYGVEGTVLPALEALLQGCALDIVYACGPRPMLRAVAALAASYGVRCQVSLEERMACGVGACLGCACKARRGAGGMEAAEYLRVCKDGPVFEGSDVVWE